MGKTKWDELRDELDTKEPWTQQENDSYQERDKNFIRNLQLSKGISKDKAKKEFHKYLNGSDKTKKKLRNAVRKAQKNYTQYPKSHTPTPVENPPHIRKKSKKKTGGEKKKRERKSLKDLTPKVRSRIINGRKKYKNATDAEIVHGVNSKWSQNWRVKHGFGRYYEK